MTEEQIINALSIGQIVIFLIAAISAIVTIKRSRK